MALHPAGRLITVTLTAFALAVLMAYATVPAGHTQSAQSAQSPLASPESDETKAKLLVIELFFLFVGLVVLGFLLILIWLSRRRKKSVLKK